MTLIELLLQHPAAAPTLPAPGERGRSIMRPLHISGLIAGVLAPLAAGTEVCRTPGFNAPAFCGWMGDAHPTWHPAVQAMHQATLGGAERRPDVIARHPLHPVRSAPGAGSKAGGEA